MTSQLLDKKQPISNSSSIEFSDVKVEKAVQSKQSTSESGLRLVANADLLGKTKASITSTLTNEGVQIVSIPIEADRFTFDQLFTDFNAPGLQQFIFTDVSVHIEIDPHKDKPTTVNFAGNLDINTTPMDSLADYLNIKVPPLLSGELVSGDTDLTDKLTPQNFSLKTDAILEASLMHGVSLTSMSLAVEISQGSDKSWAISPTAQGILEIAHFGDATVELQCNIDYHDGMFQLSGHLATINNAFGVTGLVFNNTQIDAVLTKKNQSLKLFSSFSISDKTFQLAGEVANGKLGLYTQLNTLTEQDLISLLNAFSRQSVAIPELPFSLENILIGFASESGLYADITLQEGITFKSTIQVQEFRCDVLAQFSDSGVTFSGVLETFSIGPLQIYDAVLNLNLYSSASKQDSFLCIGGKVKIEGMEVECRVVFEKHDNQWKSVVYAELNADAFVLSNVVPQAKNSFIDTIGFSRIAFIYSTFTGKTQDQNLSFDVKEGLQLSAVLEQIPALSSLTGNDHLNLILDAHFGKQSEIDISLPDTKLNLGSSVSTTPFKIGVELSPTPEFNLIFGLDVSVPKQDDPLHFDLSLAISALGATGAGTMKNYWVEPFGIKGLKVGPELALQIGIIYQQFIATGTPSEFGFVGGLVLGDVVAQMAMKLSANPADQILMGKLQQLSTSNLIAFVNDAASISIPQNALPDIIDIQDLELYVAPNGGSIGTVEFEQGFSFTADLVLFGKRIEIQARLGDDGITADGRVDKIEIGPLSIRGKKGDDAQFDLDITKSKQAVMLDGEIDFLGSGVGLFADVSTEGVAFSFEQSFLGLMSYTIEGKSEGRLDNPTSLDFSLAAEFDSQLTAYLKDDLAKKINTAADAVNKDIGEAQKEVDQAKKAYEKEFNKASKDLNKAQREANKLLSDLNGTLNREKTKYRNSLKKARADVEKAKKAFDNALSDANDKVTKAEATYKRAIKSAQADVDRASRDYNNELNSAKAKLAKAERDYNAAIKSAQRGLNSAIKKVNSLKSSLSSAKRSWKKEKRKTFPNPLKLAKYGATIAGLETSIGVANTALNVAKEASSTAMKGAQFAAFKTAQATLEAVQHGGKFVAFESAKAALEVTQKGGQYAAFETAKATLNAVKTGSQYTAWQAANESLNTVEQAGKKAIAIAQQSVDNIGKTAVYATFQAAQKSLDAVKQGSSFVAFESAKAALEGTKQSAGATLKLAELAATHAGDLVDVRHVRLAGSLKGVLKGDFFDADIDLSILKKKHQIHIDFDVQNIESFLDELFANVIQKLT